MLVDHVIAEHDDASARLGRRLLFDDFHLGTDGVARPHRLEEFAALYRKKGEYRVGEQSTRHGGGERHGEMAWTDAPAVRRSLRVGFVEEQRHVVADELAELEVVCIRDRSRCRRITLADLE